MREFKDAIQDRIQIDPYLKSIPSVSSKTNVSFHAKDDCPEVRKDVFKFSLYTTLDVKVSCIIRRKVPRLVNLWAESGPKQP